MRQYDGLCVILACGISQPFQLLRRQVNIKGAQFFPQLLSGMLANQGYGLPRAWREYLDLTRKEVASRMGISQTALSQIEKPGRKLRYATLEKLAEALNLHPEQLRE